MTVIQRQPVSAAQDGGVLRGQAVFVISTPVRDLAEFRALAQRAALLKPFGQVEVNISALATKSRHDIPPQGSPWHEYAAWNPTLFRFFPHKLIAPFIPADFVAANRQLLLAKAQILREQGLGAAFWSYEPHFLPEAFFEAHPGLRGPRVDHPRRSRREEFALCTDLEESREMITAMVRELVHHVPELGTFYFKTNDAGPGLCWSDWQYSGANGPGHCRHVDMGQRVAGLLEAITRGAQQAGGRLRVHMTGNFSRTELRAIERSLPPNCHVRNLSNASLCLGSMVDACYPVRGIFEPLGLLATLQSLKDSQPNVLFLDLRSYYDRGGERPEIAEKMIDLVGDFLAAPAWGIIATLERLREQCDHWVGAPQGEVLFDALVKLHEAMKFKRAALPGLSTIYGGVSLRYITRPLLFDPGRLSPEDEAYFLPHVFNVSLQRARNDYLDIHGSRLAPAPLLRDQGDPRLVAADQVRGQLEEAAGLLDALADTPQTLVFQHMSRAIRIYASILRSAANFYAAQVIRDRHPLQSLSLLRERLGEGAQAQSDEGAQARPCESSSLAGISPRAAASGTATSGGDPGAPDLLLFNEIMRDEFDNTQGLIDLLRDGGMNLLCHARAPAEEDTFLLGQNLVAQLQRKKKLMRSHWLDIQDYLATPMK